VITIEVIEQPDQTYMYNLLSFPPDFKKNISD